MKKTFLMLAVMIAVIFSSCKKEENIIPDESTPIVENPVLNPNAGLGAQQGYPSGVRFNLPPHIKVIGDIRGGVVAKNPIMDKFKYSGDVSLTSHDRSWTEYGTGTFVNLYIKLFNNSMFDVIVNIPGGLIFVDSTDVNDSTGTHQKGYIMQDVNINISAFDTSNICLKAYCLNLHLSPSDYNTIYYFGPVTNNSQLNLITNIMAPKQYPFGQEFDIQHIIWNVTDDGLALSQSQISYLNSLP